MEYNNNGHFTMTEDYLKELIDFQSKKTVGKILKRFEIIENTKVLKEETRELLYESFRDLRDLILAGGKGLEVTQFNFKAKGNTDASQ